MGVACDGESLFVVDLVDFGNYRIQKLRLADGVPSIGCNEGNGEGQFKNPR